MPINEKRAPGMEILTRTKILSPEEWAQFIEIYKKRYIEPYLDKFSLIKLGKFECMANGPNGYYQHGLAQDKPIVITKNILSTTDLNVSGFFKILNYDSGNKLIKNIIGLSRSAKFLLLKVEYIRTSADGGFYQKAEQVEITEADVSFILESTKIRPEFIVNWLEEQLHIWEKKARERLKQIRSTIEMSDSLKMALHEIPESKILFFEQVTDEEVEKIEKKLNETELKGKFIIRFRNVDTISFHYAKVAESLVDDFLANGCLKKIRNKQIF